jgi:hypothetical protein
MLYTYALRASISTDVRRHVFGYHVKCPPFLYDAIEKWNWPTTFSKVVFHIELPKIQCNGLSGDFGSSTDEQMQP